MLTSTVYAAQLVEAISSIYFVDLPISREHIRRNLDDWLQWLTPLRVASERDPALACWRVICDDQRDRSFIPMWLCLADDPRREYLAVAWVGLKFLPNDEDGCQNSRHIAHAAMLHSAAAANGKLQIALDSCCRDLSALRGKFPGTPDDWDKVLLDATNDVIKHKSGIYKKLAQKLRPELRTNTR